MTRHIKKWCSAGSIQESPAGRIETGWHEGDRPPDVEWNYKWHDQDRAINANGDNAMCALDGFNKNRRVGLDATNPMMQFRPNAFIGTDNIHDYNSAINKLVLTGTPVIRDMCVGWDPAQESPILAIRTEDSVATFGDSEATILVQKCWDYDTDLTSAQPETRTVYFGTLGAFKSSLSAYPVLICDGTLYVLAFDVNSPHNAHVFAYDLSAWTGYPVASIDLGSSIGTNTTQLIEADNNNIAIGGSVAESDEIAVLIVSKDLSSSTQSAMIACPDSLYAVSPFIRSDGVYIIGGCSVRQFTSPRPVVYRVEIATPTNTDLTDMGTDYNDYHITDMIPASLTGTKPGACLCLLHDFGEVDPDNPRLLWVGMAAGTMQFSQFGIDIIEGETRMISGYLGNMILNGVNLYVSCIKHYTNDDINVLVKSDFRKLINNISDVESVSMVPDDDLHVTVGPIQTAYASEQLNRLRFMTMMSHDGRDVWYADCHGGTIYRTVGACVRR